MRKILIRAILPCVWPAIFLLFSSSNALAIGQARYVLSTSEPGSFPVVQNKRAATLWVDSSDWPGVIRAVGDLKSDVARISGTDVKVSNNTNELRNHVIIIGTIGKSKLIDDLIKAGKIDASHIRGKWESFFLQVVPRPLPDLTSALVIAGSDKRGRIYGVYDLCEQMGVSPWYWWADVPVRHRDSLYIKSGKYEQGEPSFRQARCDGRRSRITEEPFLRCPSCL